MFLKCFGESGEAIPETFVHVSGLSGTIEHISRGAFINFHHILCLCFIFNYPVTAKNMDLEPKQNFKLEFYGLGLIALQIRVAQNSKTIENQ